MTQTTKFALAQVFKSLLATNGTVTSLELKNKIHETGLANTRFGGHFTQKMASDFIREFYDENPTEYKRDLQQNGNVNYYVYSLVNPSQTVANQVFSNANDAFKSTAPTPVHPNAAANKATDFSMFDFNKGSVVCYNRNNPSEFAQANERKLARTAVRKINPNVDGDHVNTCSATYFYNKFVK